MLVTDEAAVRLTALDEEINLRRRQNSPRRIQPDAVVRGEEVEERGAARWRFECAGPTREMRGVAAQ